MTGSHFPPTAIPPLNYVFHDHKIYEFRSFQAYRLNRSIIYGSLLYLEVSTSFKCTHTHTHAHTHMHACTHTCTHIHTHTHTHTHTHQLPTSRRAALWRCLVAEVVWKSATTLSRTGITACISAMGYTLYTCSRVIPLNGR